MPESGRQTLAATVVKLRFRIILCGILLALSPAILRAQGTPTVSVGWYNGDCQSTLIGSSNWYRSNLEQQFTRVYDEFVVPSGGWTVTGVFSNNLLYNAPPTTQASWEIRSGLAANDGGTVIASGVSPATQTYDSVLRAYRIQVDGLQVQLAAGDYQLSVVPAGTASGQSYVCQTQGQDAIGSPAGNGKAFRSSDPALFALISAADGTNLNFSQGVLISGKLLPLPSTSDQWRANVDSLAQQMPALHSLPFPGISLDDFEARAADLKNRIPALSGAEIRTGLLELVAAIQDSHTDVKWPFPSLFRELPISFYWFDDGIYVTAAAAQYQNLLGGRLVTVGQTAVDEATRILAALVPHENDQWLKKRIPQMELTNADYLFAKGLIAGTDSAPLQAQSGPGGVISANVQSYANSQAPPLIQVFQGSPPLSRQHLDRRYWATVIDQGATVYFQYNSCFEDPTQPSADFFKQLDQMMAQSGVERVILDMRNNSGGDPSILSPWIAKMQASRFNQPGRLYVIVGRATFSAAMEASNHLRDRTAAIFVGEPTGAKPQFLLQVGEFALPYFGIKVTYSNGVEAANDPGPTLVPDVRTGLTFQDYMNGVDPALNAILSIPAPGAATVCAGGYAISPASQSVAAAGGTGSVTVTTLAGCGWTAASNNSWITVVSGRSGVGGGTVSYSVAANSSAVSRTGTITIAGQTFTITQAALPPGSVGWYNGDCQSTGTGRSANWYFSSQQFTRVYDEFLVPSGGWTVTGVFSNNFLVNAPPVTQAAWEIRGSLLDRKAAVIASGVSPATQTYDAALGAYRIHLDGLQVRLDAGDYGLSVTPLVAASGQSYVCETQGQNAIGGPPGNGVAFYSDQSGSLNRLAGAGGTNLNFSQGVLISGKSQPPPSNSEQWQADVAWLKQKMPTVWGLPFPGISLTDFNARADELYNRIPSLSGAEVRTGLQELVAAIEDPHTDVGWPSSPSPFTFLPLSFYWFDDGIYVTAAAAQYQNLLGGRLVSVGQTGIDDATRILTALVPHENEQWVKFTMPGKELIIADFLFGKGLIAGIDSVPLQVQTPSSSPISASIQTYNTSPAPGKISVFQGTPPLSRQHTDQNYWATIIDNGATVYFQYNSCGEDSKQPSADFFKQLDQMMAQSGVERVILDMRYNEGGFTSILSPWITAIQASRFNQPGRLYVIVGRATFSAAMEHTDNLYDRTNAIFVGEPTGAKPRFQLRRGDFPLPYFGIRVSYSNGVEPANDPGPTLIPDIRTGLTFQDYMNGIDPALNAILSIPPGASPACAGSYAISPTSQSFAAAGGTGSVTVTAPAGCAWRATSNNSWITVTSGSTGSGGGTVSYSVAANNSPIALNGSVAIAGQTLTISQAGNGCSYSISPTSQSFAATGGTGTVTVTASAGCAWTAVSNNSWITVTSGSSGSASGTVNYSVAANSSANARTGTITIVGQIIVITEAAAQPDISSISPIAGAAWTLSGTGGPATQFPLTVGGSHTYNLGSADVADVAVDGAGNVFVADQGNSLVVKITAAGLLSVVAGTGQRGNSGDGGPATAALLNRPAGVAVDAKGNIYIADYNNCRVRQVNPSGVISTIAGRACGDSGAGGPATAASIRSPLRLAVGQDGSVYFTTTYAKISKVTPAGLLVAVGGTGSTGYSGDGGPATLASFNLSSNIGRGGLAVDAAGSLYVADWGNSRVRKIDATGTVTTVAGNGVMGYVGDGGPAIAASLSYPTSLVFDAAGNLYIADSWNHRIRKIGVDGTITSVAGNGVLGFSGDGGPAQLASMGDPFSVAADNAGNLYIADSENGRIRKVNAPGVITTIAGNGLFKFSGDNGAATRANFNRPAGLATDAAGNIYIADTLSNRIRRIATDGSITTVAGNGMLGFSGDGGPATAASLAWPEGSLAIDNSGNLYIPDTGNNRIRRVSPDGTITTFAGRGLAGFSGDGGPVTNAAFNEPAGLALDTAGNLYIVDRWNSRIRRVDSRGVITTFAGGSRAAFGGDGGPATAASLFFPSGIALDSAGNLYIADTSNGRFRKVDTAGIITTVAGTGASAATGGDGGPATAAGLYLPCAVDVDFLGNIYIADYGASTVRKIASDGTISTLAGSSSGGAVGGVSLSSPAAVAVDGAGNLFIADTGNDRILYMAGPSTAFRPVINAGGLVSAASYTSPLTPGGIASLFGFNLATSSVVAALPLPSVLGGVTVKVNGAAAPLFFASPNQINFQVPWEVVGQTQASITVIAGGLTSLSLTVKLATSPALFSTDASGSGQGAILIANSDTVAAPLGSIPGRNTRPAKRGEFISIFCTGLGDVTNRPPSGAAGVVINPFWGLTMPSTTISVPVASIGGIRAPVTFSGLAPGFVGLYQVNVQVLDNAPSGDAVPVVVTLGGASSNTVTIAVQ